eukprot:m.114553 g.114553  ORF g.114553 m.114553 type:complete len:98 (-) comp17117_c0_seq22:1323-1616(-)
MSPPAMMDTCQEKIPLVSSSANRNNYPLMGFFAAQHGHMLYSDTEHTTALPDIDQLHASVTNQLTNHSRCRSNLLFYRERSNTIQPVCVDQWPTSAP